MRIRQGFSRALGLVTLLAALSACDDAGVNVGPACGDGFLDPGETCDDGNTLDGDGCSAVCLEEDPGPACGDGTVDPGEECDDGNTVSGDGCSSTCALEETPPACGDGNVDPGEECDDGNSANGDGCDDQCQEEETPPVCGDGEVNAEGEECDDGNLEDGDGCDSSCQTEPTCGDGEVNADGEECDDGNTDNGDGCDENCQNEPTCGDGEVNVDGEQCDDGNTENGDGCDENCQNEPTCGDGEVNVEGEQCDDGNTENGDGCDENCQNEAVCGNDELEDGEECDDGNTDNGDGCDENCAFEPAVCGDGVIQNGETCDDGNTAQADGCSPECQDEIECILVDDCDVGELCARGYCVDEAPPVVCGDGLIEGDETCDDDNAEPGDGCDENCQIEIPDPICGNEILEEGELCDDGNTDNGDGCNENCIIEGCGNGLLEMGEECDDANLENGDGCDANCVIERVCGDNILTDDEECDDGNTDAGDGCDAECLIEPECGNGEVERGEECDDGNLDPDDGCSPECILDIVCGNGVVQVGETCDDGNVEPGDGCDANCIIEPGFVFPLAPEGECVQVGGAIDNMDPQWARPGPLNGDPCAPDDAAADHHYETFRFTNAGAEPQFIQATAAWEADGYLHIFSDPFAPEMLDLAMCLTGDDDFVANGRGATFGSQVEAFEVAPGQTIVLIASTYGRNVAIGEYGLEVCSIPAPPRCGDGIVQPENGEECDDGNVEDDDGCSALCQRDPVCGDGFVDGEEECDDGNLDPDDGCDPECQRDPVCGDSFVDDPEQCDDGNLEPGDGCAADCTFEQTCGNGDVEGTEQCDDGNVMPGDGCDAECMFEQTCGNGIVEGTEDCDDGNLEPGDGCDAECGGEQGALRLVDGETPNEGRLEIFANGEWGTICDDNWSFGDQSFINGDVACRQLGFVGAAAVDIPVDSGVDPIWLDDVACVGDEERLIDCPARPLGENNCGHGEDVGVRCLQEGECRIDAQCPNEGDACREGVCAPVVCGDGLLEGEEACDDGNTDNGDGCDENCVFEVFCSNGNVDEGEQCDDGNLEPGDGCDANCMFEQTCGNDEVEGTEQCDDGNVEPGDGCDAECMFEQECGNGEVEGTEECDDGNLEPGDRCSPLCALEPPRCGDGIIDTGEDCDDGNLLPADGCSPLCELEAEPEQGDIRLVDGNTPSEGRIEVYANGEWGTVCDDNWESFRADQEQAFRNGDVACQQLGFIGAAAVDIDVPDGVDPTWLDGVACVGDEGRLIDCPANALGDEDCGHAEDVGVRCLLPGQCRIDAQCPNDGDVCRDGACAPVVCGDGFVEGEEACDDGNTDNGDGCDENCAFEVFCGNGNLDEGEQCDDGNLEPGDGCDANCMFEQECGNNEVEGTEQCDDGNVEPGDGCDAECMFEQECGNGEVEGTEECDDGNLVSGDRCSDECVLEEPRCGDGIIDDGETCDDGNNEAGDGCDAECVAELAGCFTDFEGAEMPAAFELSGDVNWFIEDGMASSGDIDSNQLSVLTLGTSTPAGGQVSFSYRVSSENNFDWLEFYIDGERVDRWSGEDAGDVGFELAPGAHVLSWVFDKDGSVSAGEDRGLIDNVVILGADVCSFEPGCGNAVVDEGEECDDGNTADGDGCAADCTIEPGCGNGVLEDGEECDDGNLVDGDGCAADCTQEPVCGDGVIEGAEECDDGNVVDGDGCAADCTNEPVCGNGEVEEGEECDDSNVVDGDGCAADCTIEPECGNGEVEDGEQCDDGNLVDGDGCDANCVVELIGCFSDFEGAEIPAAFELSGDADWFIEAGQASSGDIDGSQSSVMTLGASTPNGGRVNFDYRVSSEANFDWLEFRIDGELADRWSGEDAANAGFDLEPGVHVLSWAFVKDGSVSRGEDRGLIDNVVITGTEACPFEPGCGNAVLDDGEGCDDGNVEPGDGCAADCTIEQSCGNGVIEGDEACDDGNTDNGDGCDENCAFEVFCGNGNLDDGEQCDDGNVEPGDGCDANCMIEQTCGNSEIEGTEQCDDGNVEPGDGCDAECMFEQTCGNGVIEGTETCDDGNVEPGDGCDAECMAEEGALRLIDGDAPNEGRLEIFANGEWGTICDDLWSSFDPPEQTFANGDVACRQLGYIGVAEVDIDVPDGVDPINLDQVACNGDEERLIDCPANPIGENNCGHTEDVGIRCLLEGQCRIDAQCPEDGDACIDGVCAPPVCGNGVVEGNEQCDDGNLVNGDGCDAVCTPELVAFVRAIEDQPNATVDGQFDDYTFTIDHTQSMVTLFTTSENCAAANTTISLFPVAEDGTVGNRIAVADQPDGDDCARLEIMVDASDYIVRVQGPGRAAMGPHVLNYRAETDVSAGGAFNGALAEGGTDLFVFDLAEDGRVVLVTDDGAGACAVDTQMNLFPIDADGNRGAAIFDDDDGPGNCSLLDEQLTAGRYEVVINDFRDNDAIDYVLNVNFVECGNGVVDPDEGCDDGNVADGDGCAADCTIEPGCGNGVIEDGEECDDGNVENGDGCDANCAIELAGCFTDFEGAEIPAAFELSGDADWFIEAGMASSGDVDGSQSSVLSLGASTPAGGTVAFSYRVSSENNFDWLEFSVDGVRVDRWSGEDAANVEFDLEPGVHVLSWAFVKDGSVSVGEDRGLIDNLIITGADACPFEPGCGNAVVDEGEACDDGNVVDGDGCAADCTIEPGCGNGIVEDGEECDDGNVVDGDGCAADCTNEPVCGDGNLDDGEECDDGNVVDGDGCAADCTNEPVCGNGAVEDGEECDDGNVVDGDGCAADCTNEPACGDGNLDDGEECDDGNVVDGDGCAADCTSEAACGDGNLDDGEQCDDGNVVDGDGCTADCRIELVGCFADFEGDEIPAAFELSGDADWFIDDGRASSGDIDGNQISELSLTVSLQAAGQVAFIYTVSSENNFDWLEFYIDGERADRWSGEDTGNAEFDLEAGVHTLRWVFDKDGSVSGGEDRGLIDNVVITGADACPFEPGCGNAVVDEGEGCDDGNLVDGDGCAADCTIEPGCGNGVVEGDEECDDGNVVDGDGCAADCTNEPACGDGNLDDGEECDDGNVVDGDGCAADCTNEPVCGDGEINQPAEQCDDGNVVDGDGCDANCLIELVGCFADFQDAEIPAAFTTGGDADWFIEAGQASSGDIDGNQISELTLNASTPAGGRIEFRYRVSSENNFDWLEFYVDGVRVDRWSGEDAGDAGFDLDPGVHTLRWVFDKDGSVSVGEDRGLIDNVVITGADACPFEPGCGNAVVDDGEECDDGNVVDGDGCAADCTNEPVCGDGNVDDGEECDDGNVVDGDGCAADCTNEPACGDGNLDAGEECDDGNVVDGDGCAADCTLEPACGDGNLDAGEECDDGNVVDGDGCAADCTLEPACGDGNLDAGEECDDGNVVDGDGCAADCTNEPVCGDGDLEGAEECDDGNVVDGDGCAADCTLEPFCGDGEVNQADEECDDGNNDNGDGCDAECSNEFFARDDAINEDDSRMAAGSSDTFRVVLDAPGRVLFFTSDGGFGCPADTRARFFTVDADGNRGVQLGDDINDGFNPFFPQCAGGLATNLRAGTYEVEITEQNDGAIAAYQMDILVAVDAALDSRNQGVIPVGGSDGFYFEIEDVGTELAIYTNLEDGTCPDIDTELEIFQVNLNTGTLTSLATDDNGGDNNCSRIQRVYGPGSYAAVVNDNGDDDAIDDYRLNVECLSCANGARPGPGDLVITEVMQNPRAIDDAVGEYFEIYNRTDTDLDLLGMVIRDDGADSYTVPESTIIPANSYAVLARSGDDAVNGGLGALLEYDDFLLANGSDEVVLVSSAGEEIDRVNYDNGATFPDPTGASMQFGGDPTADPVDDNNVGANWCESTSAFGDGDLGTPGAANDGCAPVLEAFTTQEVDDYLAADCAGCHTGGGGSGGLNFDNLSADLIGLASIDVPGMNQIEPGNRAMSYTWHKLANTHIGDPVNGSGSQMPRGGPFLSADDIERFGLWIDALP